jgi:hypothetical protein
VTLAIVYQRDKSDAMLAWLHCSLERRGYVDGKLCVIGSLSPTFPLVALSRADATRELNMAGDQPSSLVFRQIESGVRRSFLNLRVVLA